MRLLVVTSSVDRPESAVFAGLAGKGVNVHVACRPDFPCPDTLSASGSAVTHLTIRHRLDRPAIREVRRLIDSFRPDLVYAPGNAGLSVSLIASRQTACKVVGYRGTVGHLNRLDPASWLTYFHPRLAAIVCVSDAVRRYLIGKRIPASHLCTIHKGQNVDWYAEPSPHSRGDFGIPQDAFVAGFTGAMRPVKGVDVLLQALPLVPPGVNLHLLLTGEVRDPRVRRIATDPRIAPAIHFVGHRANAALLAKLADVFVMPSISREGLCRALMEAMAQGVPPIVTNVGGMPELVVDQHCGLVVPPRDPAALASAIRLMHEQPAKRRAFGAKARDRIVSDFNIESTIAQMAEFFERLL